MDCYTPSLLNRVEVVFEFLNALLFAIFDVLQDFLLGIQVTFKMSLRCFTLIDSVLESLVLLGVHVSLPAYGLEFDFGILGGQDLVFQIGLCM